MFVGKRQEGQENIPNTELPGGFHDAVIFKNNIFPTH
jgi:hypothetical protein